MSRAALGGANLYMRGLLVIVCLLVGAIFGALPASAHDSHTSRAEAAPSRAAVGPQSTLTTDGLCKTSRAIAVTVAESSGHAHDHAGDRDADHDPTDHKHPPGDDVFHQMVSHGCPDFAAHFELSPQRAFSSVAHPFPLKHEVAEGIALVPPVPPPLG